MSATTIAPGALKRRNQRFGIFSLLAAAVMLLVFATTSRGDSATFVLNARGQDQLFQLPDITVMVVPTVLFLSAAVLVIAFRQFTGGFGSKSVIMVGVVAGLFVLAFLTWAAADGQLSLVGLFRGTVARATPIALGALAGVMCERSGVINIAIEGQLLFGAFVAAAIASQFASGYAGLAAAPFAGAAVGALLAWFAVSFRVNQIIVGVVLNTLVIGLTGFLFSTVMADDPGSWNARQPLGVIRIPVLSEIPVLGPVLFQQTILVYIMYVLVAVLQFMLFRSRWGLRTRAVGEHPKAADTVGIKVNTRRVWNVVLGGAVAGLGGAFFTVGSGLAFGREMSAGQGYIALAAMILGKWNPRLAVLAALLFGFSKNLGNVLSTIGSGVPSELLLMLPYIITIFAVAGFVGRVRPPAANGTAYTKD
jgi:general nucleoside transport system permease protein